MWSPVPGARVSSQYQGGFRSTGGHSGIDFAAPQGSPIYAAAEGVVVSAGRAGAYGNLVKVQHADGSIGYYAHMHNMSVRPGMQVARGMQLGTVGSTGNSTGPHLHFEIRQGGSPVDPTPWLDASGAPQGTQGYMPDMMAGNPVRTTLPDLVQYRDPRDVLEAIGLSSFESQTIGNPLSVSDPASNMPVGVMDAFDNWDASGSFASRTQFLRQQRMEQEQMDQWQSLIDNHQGDTVPGFGLPGGGGHGSTGGDFDRLFAAIRDKESGGNYNARNASSGALGAYQIMPANIGPWSQAALGRRVSTQEFLSNPGIQDQIARHQLHQYYRQHGAQGAALAWYAGPGALRYSQASLNRPQGRYPSMNDYVRDILRRAGL